MFSGFSIGWFTSNWSYRVTGCTVKIRISPEKCDYEYVRKGTANIFVAVEPRTGKRITKVTKRRTKKDFAMFVKEVLDKYPKTRKLHIILDNLNTHFASSFQETFGEEEAPRILQRIEFHYTPKHAS